MKKLSIFALLNVVGTLSIPALAPLAQANCVDLTGTYQPDPNNSNCTEAIQLPLSAGAVKSSLLISNSARVELNPGFGLKQEGCGALTAVYATVIDPNRGLIAYSPASLDMEHAQISGSSILFRSTNLQLSQLPSGDLSLNYGTDQCTLKKISDQVPEYIP
jgi:hypothetical protein